MSELSLWRVPQLPNDALASGKMNQAAAEQQCQVFLAVHAPD
jgi:hypothetical protein